MLESLEGKRGEVRPRPPLPAIKGLFGQPTIVNNVISLASVPIILAEGRRVLPRLRHRQVARHADDSARRQHQARRPHREGVRRHAARAALRLRRRQRHPAGRFARCRSAGRSAPTCRSRSSTRRSTTRRSPASARCSATAASSSSTTPWTWRRWRATRMEFCAIESCGKCTPCRIGSTRGVEVIDRVIAGQNRDGEPRRCSTNLCDTMVNGSLCGLGGMTPLPGPERAAGISGKISRRRRSRLSAEQHGLTAATLRESSHVFNGLSRSRDAGRTGAEAGHARDRRRRRSPCPKARRSCAPRRRSARQIPKLCATDTLKAFGSCRLCLVEIEGRRGYPASCTTLVADGMKVRTESPKLTQLRRSVMELYVSDHPLDCVDCPANGHCELQDMAEALGVTDTRYGAAAATTTSDAAEGRRAIRTSPSIQSDVHRLLALRARLRRSAGHVRADDPGPRLRLEGRRRARTSRSWSPSACRAARASRRARPAR